MKKKIIIAGLALMGLFTHAQEIKDNLSKRIFLGGEVAYRYNKDKKPKDYSVNIKPNIAYFFTKDIAGGLKVGYTYEYYKKTSATKSDKYDNHTFSTTPFIRKYWNTDHRFMPSIELNAEFKWDIKKKDNNNVGTDPKLTRYEKKRDGHSWGVGLAPGFSYRLSDNAFLHTNIGRLGYTKVGGQEDKYEFDINLTNLALGVDFFL